MADRARVWIIVTMGLLIGVGMGAAATGGMHALVARTVALLPA